MKTIPALPRKTPEAQGIDSGAISDFLEQANYTVQHLHSLMLLRHGAVVAEGWWHPYQRDYPHMLFSLSKSFTSTAIGLAINEGLLRVDDPVLKFFPEDAPTQTSNHLAAMEVQHLLSMTTGHDLDTTEQVMQSRSPSKTFFSLPIVHPPGTHFVYNTAATFMLAIILSRLTGQTLLDYLTPRLMQPLGILEAAWDSHPNGVNFGGFGLHLKTEDLARFGQLYLQKGWWNGAQLIPAEWVALATAKHADNSANQTPDWQAGYGFQFWRCQPAGIYRGDGAFGQFCIIMPEQDAVLAITSGLADLQRVLDLVWEKILPAMQPEPLPDNPAAHQALLSDLRSLAIKRPDSLSDHPSIEGTLSGKTWLFQHNQLRLHSFSIDFESGKLIYRLMGSSHHRETHTLPFGRETWVEGAGAIGLNLYRIPVPSRTVSSGAWTAADTFTITICLVETPFIVSLAFRFFNEQVGVKYRVNVSFGPLELPEIVGVQHA